MKKIWKWKNQKLAYAAAAVGVVCLICLFSLLLEAVTNRAEKSILSQTEYRAAEQTESGKRKEEQTELPVPIETEAQTEDSEKNEKHKQVEETADQREEYAKELVDYEKRFQPEITGDEENILYFLDSEEKESQFLKTIADFTYSIFGDAVIDHIKIGSLVFEDEESIAYQIQLVSEEETMPCEIRYDKKNRIFGLY